MNYYQCMAQTPCNFLIQNMKYNFFFFKYLFTLISQNNRARMEQNKRKKNPSKVEYTN